MTTARAIAALCALLFTGAPACTDATYGNPDLPDDWAGASHIERLSQSACGGSAIGAPSEAINAIVNDRTVELSFTHAHFRCQQDVEAYLRQEGTTLDVLVQPINLNPPLVAGCDCQYEVSIVLPAPKRERLPAGTYRVNLFRRWDNINHPNDPIAIGSADVEIP